jgi:hypothetical protein
MSELKINLSQCPASFIFPTPALRYDNEVYYSVSVNPNLKLLWQF